ncbi:MAG: hypothetical protein OET44_16855 [Gammaproteobacteria bacterium]|nr:hypothetical protein [Gammaproteobacteria bacterium]
MSRDILPRMKAASLLVLLFTVFTAPAWTVEISQGQQYTGGTLLQSSEAGIALRVPEGWQGAWPAGSEMLVLATLDGAGYIFVHVAEMNEDAATELMSQPVPLGDGIVLQPESSAVKDADGLIAARYRVTGAPQPWTAQIKTRIGPHGVGAAFVTLGKPAKFDAVATTARALALATQFEKPVTPPPAVAQSGNGSNWQDYMRGRYVVRYYTGSGYTEEDHIWLCSDGTFHRSTASGGFGGGASGAFSGSANGRWQASGVTGAMGELVLQYGPGAVSENSTTFGDWTEQSAGYERIAFSLEIRNDKLYLNGKQWFRDSNQKCR